MTNSQNAGGEAAATPPLDCSASEIGAIAIVFHPGWMVFACVTLRLDQRSWRTRQSLIAVG